MRKIIFILFFAIIFSCKKEEPKSFSVAYKIIETTTAVPAYIVAYTTENATQTEGPITFANWSSPTIKKLEGETVSFTLDGGSGTGSFIMRIYANGVLLEEQTMDNPFGPKTISAIVQ